MCGITGFRDFKQSMGADALRRIGTNMSNTLVHRGPDGGDVWVDDESCVVLAHRRLAIVDLSDAGAQPMHSASGRFVTVFNGEIYNFLELRRELESAGQKFNGHSDTEVLLSAFEVWGVESALKRFNGMFAIALWDRHERSITLVRDRLGKKPVYYGWSPDHKTFYFGSELKSLRAHPEFCGDIDRRALTGYIAHNYVPAPLSIYQGIFKLPPASWMKVDNHGQETQGCYWSIENAVLDGLRSPVSGGDRVIIDELETLLTDATRLRMLADVPLGAFLSGGIDSSLVVALAAKISSSPLRTYSIGFEEGGFDEAQSAKLIAQHLNTDHTEFYVTSEDARSVIPKLPAMFDEPFADSSQIPTYCVAHLARRDVTVALSGDGGDEVFSGYSRYAQADFIAKKLFMVPQIFRSVAAFGAHRLGGKWSRYADVLRSVDEKDLYTQFITLWRDPSNILINATQDWPVVESLKNLPHFDSFTSYMQYHDMAAYLPDDILVKVDRTSMATSLEARAPLLDYRVLEYSWRLPPRFKNRNGKAKWILREILEKHIPSSMYDRPKQGFGIPQGAWLRGPLKEWAGDLLAQDRIKREGYFHPERVSNLWREHISEQRDQSYRLWGILMFQSWMDYWHDR